MHHHDDRRSDAALVALALAGEGEVFGTLLLRYYASVARLCHRLLGPTSEAQDVAQEAALQAFLGLSTLNEPARFGAWLHAIAANLARMELRRRRTLSLEALQDPSSSSGRGAAMVVLWAAGPPTPEEVHAAREVHDTIVAALSELSVVNREVVIGFYLEGYSYAELAELLGVPVSTVKGRLFKGRRQLRETLAPTAREVLKPDRRPRKERLMEASELVEVKIESIRSSVLTQSRVVVLSEQGGERLLPIWIGVFEGDAIRLALEGYQPQRPMTHDLALRLITPLGAQVQHVVVNKLAETTFYAQITLAVDGQVHEIDARPSDAIALAVRAGAPIYVARSVFDTAGTTRLEERLKQDEQHVAAELAASARPGENTWVLLFESRTETGPSNVFPVLHFTSADWPGTSY
ncbi:MAG TPA: bifunctional nuclease domain-containing protein, partial [Roseiflexaceae bacterium]